MNNDISISNGSQVFKPPWRPIVSDQMMEETPEYAAEVLKDVESPFSSAKLQTKISPNFVNNDDVAGRRKVLDANDNFASQYKGLYENSSNQFVNNKTDDIDDEGTPKKFNLSAFNMENSPELSVIKNVQKADGTIEKLTLRPVQEIPEKYRSVFPFKHFNALQSKVFEEVMYSEKPIVVCAPTGSGKTVLFELCIVRLLLTCGDSLFKYKIIYMAPIKALCSERFQDWSKKFSGYGLKCQELTGDTELDDFQELTMSHILFTTPEKWDSMTRRWKDHKSLVQSIRLFMIDEVHLVNDDTRGATMEAVVSRMKTVQVSINESSAKGSPVMRFVAVSATIPNVNDIAAWLDTGILPAVGIKCGEEYRPVALRKVVLGYPFYNSQTDFKFDMMLSYKLSNVIQTYSDNKPTLVFCNTRKSVTQGAGILVKDARFSMTHAHKQRLANYANMMHDTKLQECVYRGVGFHHAGLDMHDRKNIEEIFAGGNLPVLFCTSTLAMGVNLPAHLVIVKGTMYYMMGGFTEYSEAQVLQMMGRAGRPQFDTSATAVIMTKEKMKMKYQGLVLGNQNIESSLHLHLTEHVMAEVVLGTIENVNIAQEWLKSTFLYRRMLENPKHYGAPVNLDKAALGRKLQAMCLRTLKSLESFELISLRDEINIVPTETGKLMARFCIVFDTVKIISSATGKESLDELLGLLSKAKELEDLKVRANEKKTLNALNQDKNHPTIRFPMDSKIKTTEMKVNCLLQAGLGCLPVNDFSLSQDSIKLFQSAQRIAKFMMEYFMQQGKFQTTLNSIILFKCIKAKLWENSKYVSKQIDKIGPTLSSALVNAGITSFSKLEATNPRELEMIMNRHPPFGTQVKEVVAALPKYDMIVEQEGSYQDNTASLLLTVKLLNYNERAEYLSSKKMQMFGCVVVIGDHDNRVVFKHKLMDYHLTNTGIWTRKININTSQESESHELNCYLINLDYVGLDIQSFFTPVYLGYFPKHVKVESNQIIETPKRRNTRNTSSSCNHKCIDKFSCGHQCCKNHFPHASTPLPPKKKLKKNNSSNVYSGYKESPMISQLQQEIQRRKATFPNVFPLKKIKLGLAMQHEQQSYTPGHTPFMNTQSTPDGNLDMHAYEQNSCVNFSDIKQVSGGFDHFSYKQKRLRLDNNTSISERKSFRLLPDDSFESTQESRPSSSHAMNRSFTSYNQLNSTGEVMMPHSSREQSYSHDLLHDDADDDDIYEFDDEYLKNDCDEPLPILTFEKEDAFCSSVNKTSSHRYAVNNNKIDARKWISQHNYNKSSKFQRYGSSFNENYTKTEDCFNISSDEEIDVIDNTSVPKITPYNHKFVNTGNTIASTLSKNEDDLLFGDYDNFNRNIYDGHQSDKENYNTSLQYEQTKGYNYNRNIATTSHETPTRYINCNQKRSVRDLFSVKSSVLNFPSDATQKHVLQTSPLKSCKQADKYLKILSEKNASFSLIEDNSLNDNGDVKEEVDNVSQSLDWQGSVFCDDLENSDNDEYGFSDNKENSCFKPADSISLYTSY